MADFEELNSKYFDEVTKAVNALVDSKVAVHAHDKILDDQIDDFKERLVSHSLSKLPFPAHQFDRNTDLLFHL